MSKFQLPPNQPQYTSPEQYQQPPSPPKKRGRRKFFAIGCGALIALVVLIGVIAAAASTGNGSAANKDTSATQPAQATQAVQPTQPIATPTSKPTVKPTQAPTPIPTHAPTPKPTQPPAPKPTSTPTPSCQAVNNNPWCYNFTPGKLIYVPPNGFCNYFNCIATFYAPDDPGDGYIIECSDSTFSQSGGESGACSSHGGVLKPLYSH